MPAIQFTPLNKTTVFFEFAENNDSFGKRPDCLVREVDWELVASTAYREDDAMGPGKESKDKKQTGFLGLRKKSRSDGNDIWGERDIER